MSNFALSRRSGLRALFHFGAPSLVALVIAGNTGCDMIEQFMAPGPEIVEAANDALRDGDLPAASAEFEKLAADHPNAPHVAIGHAFSLLMAGNTKGADQTLAAVEESAGEQIGEIKLRRALVALAAGDLDSVKIHGKASGRPEGMLLAAEVHLVDLESDEAMQILRDIESSGGAVGETAARYLEMLDSDDQIQAGLAEATALWALGEREAAASASEELVRELETDDRDEQLLLWAGRAVTSGQPEVAASLLEDMESPVDGQVWRGNAIRAMIHVAQGETEMGIKIFNQLAQADAADVPPDGLADAMATACALTDDRAAAKELAGQVESAAAARCLLQAGAGKAAQAQAPPGALKNFLENR